jgi:hypothetical protein
VQRGHARSGCWLPVVSYRDGGTTCLPWRQAWGFHHGMTTTDTNHSNARQGAQKARWQVQGHPTGVPAEGQQWPGSASKATRAKPNPFDEIARQVNADQEAKDRAAGRDDLTPASATSVDQAKAKPSGTNRAATKPAKPAKLARPPRLTGSRRAGTESPLAVGRRPRSKRSPLG